ICKHVDQQTAIPTPNLCEWDANVAYEKWVLGVDPLERRPIDSIRVGPHHSLAKVVVFAASDFTASSARVGFVD
ncbi:hypothetical protein, partial [Bradyrhizobium japonicum]|uniref:hypothetical protein n=1 Tax=Bradyrhizobium japonicum TaxID=375 RepID=UPI001AECC04F